jgi:hypothetical protein
MITVAEFARKHSVSVQTIYRRLNKVDAEGLTVKQNGILYITPQGENELTVLPEPVKDSLTGVEQPNVKHELTTPTFEKQERAREYNEMLIPFMREQNEFLRDELSREREHSRAQATRLAELSEQIAELVRNNQILIAAEQNRNNIGFLNSDGIQDVKQSLEDSESSEEPPRKQGFIKRLLGKDV